MALWMRITHHDPEAKGYNSLPSTSLTFSVSLQTTLLCLGTTGAWWCSRCPGSNAYHRDGHHLHHHPLALTFLPSAQSWKKRGGMGHIIQLVAQPPAVSFLGTPANYCKGPLSFCTGGCLQFKSPLLGREETRTCVMARLEGLQRRLPECTLKVRLCKARSQLEQAGIHRALAIYTSCGFGLLFFF